MNCSQKCVLDDVAVVTHQKFPPYLTRRNFKTDSAYQLYFNLLNNALISAAKGIPVRQFANFTELCQLLQKEAILETDQTLLRVDDYATDYLGKICEFFENAFAKDECDQVILQTDDQDDYPRNEVGVNLCTLDLAKVAIFDKFLVYYGSTSAVQLSENMYGKEPSHWWREQDFVF